MAPARAEPSAPRRAKFALVVVALCGVLFGLGTFTFVYGAGAAYLRDDPRACVSCHVMQAHYDDWLASSHQRVATCDDCHLPAHPISKWLTKADNGFWHALAFTRGACPDPLRIEPRQRAVTQAACLACHRDAFHTVAPEDGSVLCVHCHADVGHRRR